MADDNSNVTLGGVFFCWTKNNISVCEQLLSTFHNPY